MSNQFVLRNQSFSITHENVAEIVRLAEGNVDDFYDYSDDFLGLFQSFTGLSLHESDDGFFVGGQEIYLSEAHEEFLKKIAPYVEEGSWLEFQDTEHHFRLVFDGVSVKEVHPKIIWELN